MSRRDFDPLPQDRAFLDAYGLPWETVLDGQGHWVLIHDFRTHEGYSHESVTVAIRLETGYPDAQLDMAYFHPALTRKDGRGIANTEQIQTIDGVAYQRWSRHRTGANPWMPGEDSLETHVLLVEDWLTREFA